MGSFLITTIIIFFFFAFVWAKKTILDAMVKFALYGMAVWSLSQTIMFYYPNSLN